MTHWCLKLFGPLFVAFGAAVCFSFSLQCGFLFLVSMTGSASALIVLFLLPASVPKRTKSAFMPVQIRPASLIPTVTPGTIASAGIATGSIAVFVIFFAFHAVFFPINGKKGLYLPVPTRYTDTVGWTTKAFSELEQIRGESQEELPDLGSLITWVWNTLVFPYYSLNAPNHRTPPEPGMIVSMPLYSVTDSLIVGTETPVYVFDDAFIAEVIDKAIDGMIETPIEQVLKKQGQFVTVSYSMLEERGNQGEPLVLFLLLAAAIVPVTALIFELKRKVF
jgi:hypothetical protein